MRLSNRTRKTWAGWSVATMLLAPLALSTLLGSACSSSASNGPGTGPRTTGGASAGSGGLPGTGGRTQAGGTTSVTSNTATGGAASTGGRPGSGGAALAHGGAGQGGTGTGGVAGTGGSGFGGITAGGGGTTGTRATGGVVGSGAAIGIGTGGASTGGLTGSGVATGGRAGGSTGTADGGGAGPVRLAWTNPLVPQRADPHVFLHSDGYYYLTATVPEYDRIELRRATSIGGLSSAERKVVWKRHTTGEMANHIWAPEIHFIDGAWYVYFTAGRSDDSWAIRMYALKNVSANPLDGEWTELGRIVTNWDSFSLDATTFAHAGQRYYLWTQTVPDYPGTSVLIAKMSSPTKLTGAQVVLTSPDLSWEKQGHEVNEAPAALVKNGKVFITYSASATDYNYCMGMLTADASADLLDRKSWKKSSQPVFQSNSQTSQFGPGHNSFTTTADGRIDILVYHARNYRNIVGEPLDNPDRATRAQHLPFDASGMPVFGVPVADGAYQADVVP